MMAKKDKAKKGKDKQEESTEEGGKGGKGKLIIIIVVALLVLGGGGGGVAFFLLGGESEEANETADVEQQPEDVEKAVQADPRYVDLDPDFTVNMDANDNRRFVQVAISLLTYFEETEEAIKENTPIIRNNIILMIGRKSSDELASATGKNELQQEIHDEVVRVLEENAGSGAGKIEKVLFTKFVMQ